MKLGFRCQQLLLNTLLVKLKLGFPHRDLPKRIWIEKKIGRTIDARGVVKVHRMVESFTSWVCFCICSSSSQRSFAIASSNNMHFSQSSSTLDLELKPSVMNAKLLEIPLSEKRQIFRFCWNPPLTNLLLVELCCGFTGLKTKKMFYRRTRKKRVSA